ncbi:MAG: hypothetical protein LM517_03670 [Nitrosomonas sp.]|nr:hypothetical protein [Nitrosomonas sp.]
MAIIGTDVSDKLIGTVYNDTIDAKGGNDNLNGLGGDDNLYGGQGSDTYEFSGVFSTSNGFDRIWEVAGEGTADTVHILTGSNPGDIPASAVRVVGRNQYFDSNSVQIIVDGFGTIHLNSQLLDPKVEWLKIGNNAPISLTGGLTMKGGAFSEDIKGTKFDDIINGMGGNDTLRGSLGNDTYIIDKIGASIIENLNEGTDIVKSSISHSLSSNVENLTLTGILAINGSGNDLNNKIIGNAASNQLNGGIGDDTLDGQLGNDILTGGTGKDSFNLTTSGNIDTIKDFVAVDDTIRLENAVFTKLTTTGTLAASRFKIGAQAMDADDYIIYNNTTGALYYDSNGNGTGATVQIATIGIGLNITNADFVVI